MSPEIALCSACMVKVGNRCQLHLRDHPVGKPPAIKGYLQMLLVLINVRPSRVIQMRSLVVKLPAIMH